MGFFGFLSKKQEATTDAFIECFMSQVMKAPAQNLEKFAHASAFSKYELERIRQNLIFYLPAAVGLIFINRSLTGKFPYSDWAIKDGIKYHIMKQILDIGLSDEEGKTHMEFFDAFFDVTYKELPEEERKESGLSSWIYFGVISIPDGSYGDVRQKRIFAAIAAKTVYKSFERDIDKALQEVVFVENKNPFK